MRFQTLYVDMRPVLTKWLGILAVALFLILLYFSLKPDIDRAFVHTTQTYINQNKAISEGKGMAFWRACALESGCLKKMVPQWTAPLPLKAFIIGGTFFGLLSAAFGMYWRPEIMANRDIRVNSTRIDQSRESSPTAPKGTV